MKSIKYWLIFLCFFNAGYCGTIDPSTSDSKYLEYGSQFHCVVRICGVYNDNSLYCASGVLIDNHHVLTAAHVVNNSKLCTVTLKDKQYIISQIVVNKDFDTQFATGDIAIGYSEESFNLESYPALYEDTDEIGKVCSMAGYGLTGTFLTGAKTSDGNKRAGSNIVDNAFKDVLVCSPSRRGEKGYTSLEFCIASGDSGGGLFVDGKLAGINSFIMSSNKSPNAKYGEESCHTRISKFIGWINENKKKDK